MDGVPIYKEKKSKSSIVYLLVFLLASLWVYSLTYNFNFFWEDSSYALGPGSRGGFPSNLILQIIKTVLNPYSVLFSVGYGFRPLNDLYFAFFPVVFGSAIVYYRLFKVILAGLLFTLCFKFFMGNNKEARSVFSEHTILCFLGISYLMVLPEFWLFSMYLIDSMLFATVVEMLALWLFFFHYLPDNASSKKYALVFFFIVFFTHIATLTRHFGRINFILIFLFLLLSNWRKIFYKRMLALIFALFMISIPVIGILTTGDVLGVTGLKSHTGAQGWSQLFLTNLEYFKTIHLAFLPHALFLVILFVVFFALHTYARWIRKQKEGEETTQNNETANSLRQLAIFSFLWFLLTSLTLFIARGFVFDRTSFLRFQFMVFIIPQTLFLISYGYYVYQQYFSKQKVIKYLFFILIILAILHNVQRLNEWRGGWGAYFLGYDTVRQYVDEHAEHAVLIFPFDHAAPTFFLSSNTALMEQDQTNTTLLLMYKQNYTQVFITNRYELSFNESFVVNVANLTILDNSPYGVIKKMIGKYYATPMYLYEVKP